MGWKKVILVTILILIGLSEVLTGKFGDIVLGLFLLLAGIFIARLKKR